MAQSVAEYVQNLGGDRVIDKVLIANNGIGAVKAIRSIRQWAYKTFGDEKAIQFVVMATPEDLHANAEYIRMADEFEEVPGGSNNNNYANVNLIVDIAERTGVQGVWAGWGHASENPNLPRSLNAAGINFLGPPAGPMQALGDKISSTLVAQTARVPSVPWSGTGLELENYNPEKGIDEEVYRKACVTTPEEAKIAAKRIGLPIMIKASEGGGGKGIRKVNQEEDIEQAFRTVQGEVPGSPIFMMKLVSKCRHLEVQILADKYGEAVALFGRDCTVQRRHQKVIEEGPPIAAKPEVWDDMEACAVRLVKLVGYVGAGTVEYLYADGTYTILELNPRLQVEHPVTEQITGVNLPACQLQIAMGIPLHRIPDIRKLYGQPPLGNNKIDFSNTKPLPPQGHVIAVRVTAENADQGFKPTSGAIQELTFRSTPNVWGYFSVGPDGGLHEFADSQFGHLFAWGPARDDSRKNMVLALKEIMIRGDIHTPLEYLIDLLETESFKNNDYHTEWLDSLIAQDNPKKKQPEEDALITTICAAICKGFALFQGRTTQYITALEKGQIPPYDLLRNTDAVEIIFNNVKYKFTIARSGVNSCSLSLTNAPKDSISIEAEFRPLSDGGLLILLNGKSHVCYGKEEATGYRLILNGKTTMFGKENDASELRTATPGKLVRYLVETGSHIKAGTSYAEIEVMKVYLPLISQEAGVIHFVKNEGSVLEAGDLVATMELDNPSEIKKVVDFPGPLPEFKPPRKQEVKCHQLLRSALAILKDVLLGYERPKIAEVLDEVLRNLRDSKLPVLEVSEVLSAIASRLPKKLYDNISSIVAAYQAFFPTVPQSQAATLLSLSKGELPSLSLVDFSGESILQAIQSYEETSLTPNEAKTFTTVVEPLRQVANKYAKGLKGNIVYAVSSLLQEYLSIESLFQDRHRDAVMLSLREKHKKELLEVFAVGMSRNKNSKRNNLIVLLLDRVFEMGPTFIEELVPVLHELAALRGPESNVSLKARQLLIRYQLPSFPQRKAAVEEYLRKVLKASTKEERSEHIESLTEQSVFLFDVFVSFFTHPNRDVRKLALELYVRRAYQAYQLQSVQPALTEERGLLRCEWSFFLPDLYTRSSSSNSLSSSGDSIPASPAPTSGIPLRRSVGSFRPSESVDDLLKRGSESLRYGMIVVVESITQLYAKFDDVLQTYKPHSQKYNDEYINVLQFFLVKKPTIPETQFTKDLAAFANSKKEILNKCGIRRMTISIDSEHQIPRHFTFRDRLNFAEDAIYRDIEPPLAHHLELKRLFNNFDIQLCPTENHQIHLYYAEGKNKDPTGIIPPDRCLFARAIVGSGDIFNSNASRTRDLMINEAEKVFAEALEALEIAIRDKKHAGAQNHHIFLKVIPEIVFQPEKVPGLLRDLGTRYGRRLWKLRVCQLEVAARLRDGSSKSQVSATPVRFIIVNPSGYSFHVSVYLEVRGGPGEEPHLKSFGQIGPLEGLPVSNPYPAISVLQRKRFTAQDNNTTYVYDFPEIFRRALKDIWVSYIQEVGKDRRVIPTSDLIETYELVMNESTGELEEVQRPPATNNVGMIAWRVVLKTPEAPEGREVVLIANDITYENGTFGPREDKLYLKASQFARKRGIPRIYLAANSGARIGLAQEVKNAFQVAWNDPSNPQKGFKYLYLSDEDYTKLSKTHSVIAQRTEVDKEVRWVILDVIGKDDGLGVENLRGSGMIAGETSRAYEEIFTITLVTGRTVGIGAYLVRLGQRTVQNQGPVILTGAPALNKVLGREVYSSNVQLGGPQIMYANGVSHLDVNDELKGIIAILTWLGYIPKRSGGPLPVLPTNDPVIRPIGFQPTTTAYNPRHMLAGYTEADGTFVSGFFDKGSWMETLAGWAKTAICGRARLGGIPVGVVTCETRTVEHIRPADPANPESQEIVVQQAGQVWFPDSAYKTAQAIKDFNKGEELPLFIFANWRGFSGGMRDMFDEILKFGSYIVDNLREYRQPVFIYLPPFGELRGGAWVVLDPTINPEAMEMFSDPRARGGVLEPAGTVEIKYRQRDLIKTMHRLDPKLKELRATLEEKKNELSTEKTAEIQAQINSRERQLLESYQGVAIGFADLHDTPGRMKEKGAISAVVEWNQARTFFYHRLRRRLLEQQLRRSLIAADSGLKSEEVTEQLQQLVAGVTSATNESSPTIWARDAQVVDWLEGSAGKEAVNQLLINTRKNFIKRQVASWYKEDIQAAKEVLVEFFPQLKSAAAPAPH